MANWTYSDWNSTAYTTAQQAQRGSLFLGEILEKIAGADVSAHGYARNTATLERLYEVTKKAVDEVKAAAAINGGVGLATFPRPR